MNRQPKCILCDQPGHWFRQCPRLREDASYSPDASFVCFNCGKIGHSVPRCPEPLSIANVESRWRTFRQKRMAGGTPLATADGQTLQVTAEAPWTQQSIAQMVSLCLSPPDIQVQNTVLLLRFPTHIDADKNLAHLKAQNCPVTLLQNVLVTARSTPSPPPSVPSHPVGSLHAAMQGRVEKLELRLDRVEVRIGDLDQKADQTVTMLKTLMDRLAPGATSMNVDPEGSPPQKKPCL